MKITITALFGRVQVEVPAEAAVRLMLDAVRTAYLEGLEDPSPREELEEAWRDALGIGENGVSNTGNRLESTPLWGPGEAKRAELEEGDDTPGNESGGVTAKADGVNPSSATRQELPEGQLLACMAPAGAHVTAAAVPPSPEGEGSEGAAEQESYRGFLYTRCGKCGKIKGYCSKSYIKGMRCECGHRTPFRNLRVMTVRCSSCGEVFKYHTNLTEEQFTIECLHCGAPVEMMLHGRTGEYVAY